MSLTFDDARIQYQQYLEQDGKAKATILAYTTDVEQLAEYAHQQGKGKVDEINHGDIAQFKALLKKRRYTSKTISRKVNSIKSFFRFLQDKQIMEDNPAEEVSHPKIKSQPPRYLSKLEYRALRDTCRGDARIYAIVELLLQTGMRISELASLQMEDVDLERDVLYIRAQKSRDARRVPLNRPAKQALMDYLKVRPKAKEKTVFLTKTCNPFLVRNIRAAVNRYFKKAGIPEAKVNDLRSTFIVEQLKAGTPLIYVSQLVGHRRITTTEKYMQMIEEAEQAPPKVEIEEL
ncbi:MAG: tyrosine-type recombinase/integrase [Candidatus Pacebacteria bacterium]|nr:tyrosine-type recombinase/integrase [Candidatus Paceibacterota bacterium]